MKAHVAEAKVVVDAPPARVWAALTDPDQVRRYMMGADVASDWKPGSPIRWSGEYNGHSYQDKGEVLEVEEGRRLVHTHYSALSGAEDVPENYHTLAWTLEEVDEGIELTLAQDNNATPEEAEQNRKNWAGVLQALKDVVEG